MTVSGKRLIRAVMPVFTIALMATVAVVARPAAAATMFSAGAEIQGASFCTTGSPACKQVSIDSPTPTSATRTVASFPWNASATASSGVGVISSSTSASRNATGGSGGFAFARGTASFRLDDITITKLPGFEALPDTFTLSFDLAVDYDTNKIGFAGANDLSVLGGIDDAASNIGSFIASTDTVITRSKTISVNTLLFIHIGIDINSAVSSAGDNAEAMVALGLDPLAVFNLPQGYTADSADGLISANRLVTGGMSPVPLPSAILLFLGGLVSLFGVGMGWRKAN